MEVKNSQQFSVSIQPQDKRGQAARIDGVPVWASSDETILQVLPSEDGLTATVKAVGPTGDAKVTATADADLGEGVTPITGFIDVTVIGGDAVLVSLIPGAVEEQAE